MIFNKLIQYRDQNRENIAILLNYLFVVYIFLLPISTTLMNIVFNIILFFYLVDGNLKNKIKEAWDNNFIRALILFYLMHIVWLYGISYNEHAIESVKNSRYLLYGIIYFTVIRKEFIFKILNAYLLSIFFSEIVSYLISFQIIAPFNNATVDNPVPFVLSHSQYAVYLGLSMGIILYMMFQQHNSKFAKFIYILFFISATINIFIIASRLGFILYMANIILIVFYIYRKYLVKAFIIMILLLSFGYTLAYQFSNTFNTRVHQLSDNITQLYYNQDYSTSLGVRVGYWIYSYDILKENLLFGVIGDDYRMMVKENILSSNENNETKVLLIHSMQNGLHSDFLDIFVKFGFIGLVLYLNIFYQLYKNFPQNELFRIVQLLLIISFFLSGLQGGTLLLRDLGRLFIILGTLSVIDTRYINSVKR